MLTFFLLSLTSCVQKQEQLSNKSLGRFSGDVVSLTYSSTNNVLTIGSPITISPIATSGNIVGCGVKYNTANLPPGLSIDTKCNIIGTPLVLALSYTYKIVGVSEFNTVTEASVKITVGTFYNLGGTVSGLGVGESATISNGLDILVPALGNENFSLTPVANGTSYSVTASEGNPARYTCTVVGGSGTISQHTNNVQVTCAPSGLRILSGTLAGLVPADGSVEITNGGITQTLTNNGVFSYGSLNLGVNYNIAVSSMPLGYTCALSPNAAGTLTDDINSIVITCTPPTPKSISVNVSGLNIGTLIVKNVGTDNNGIAINDSMTINSNGSFTFLNKEKYNTVYNVTIQTQPTEHTCSIANPTGTTTIDVTNINITCTANTHSVGGTVSGLTVGDYVKFVFNDTSAATEVNHAEALGASYTIPRSFEYGRQYRMYITEVPAGKKCTFTTTNGSPPFTISDDAVSGFIGKNSTTTVNDLNITCTPRETANCEFGHKNYAVPTGVVSDMVCDGASLYVAGSFVGQSFQTGTTSKIASTDLLASYKQSFKVEGGGSRTAVEDGNGGMYIGGDFTKVNGEVRNRLAHFLADGSLDQNFNPDLNGSVYKIIISGDYLYVGGAFTTVGASTRNRFAKLHRHSGALASLNMNFNNTIYDMILRGTSLDIGGIFTTVNTSIVKDCLAELDTTTDTLSSLSISLGGVCTVYTLEKDSSNNLYVGGIFLNAGGVAGANSLFKLNTNGTIDSSFFPTILTTSCEVYKIRKITEGVYQKLLIGGNFSSLYYGTSSPYIAKYNMDTSLKETINYSFPGGSLFKVYNILEDNSYNYVVDYYGKIVRYPKGVETSDLALTNTTSNLSPGSLLELINNKIIKSDTASSSMVYASQGSSYKYMYRYNLNTGLPDSDFNLNPSGAVSSIVKDGTSLYVAGAYSSILGQNIKRYLVKVDASLTPQLLDSNFTTTLNSYPTKIIMKNSELITLGGFTSVDGVATGRKYLVSLSPTTGLWRSTIDDSSYTSQPLNITDYNNDLYVTNSGATDIRKYDITYSFSRDTNFSAQGTNLKYVMLGPSNIYIGGGTSYVAYNGGPPSKYLIKLYSNTQLWDNTFSTTIGYSSSAPFISTQGDLYLLYSSLSKISTNGITQPYTNSSMINGTSSNSANKYIEGSTFLIIGGSFNQGYTYGPANLLMVPK